MSLGFRMEERAHLLVLSQRHLYLLPKEPHLLLKVQGQHWEAREGGLQALSHHVLEETGPFVSVSKPQGGFQLYQEKPEGSLREVFWTMYKHHSYSVHVKLICLGALEQNMLTSSPNEHKSQKKAFHGLNLVSIFKCHLLLTTIWSGNEVYYATWPRLCSTCIISYLTAVSSSPLLSRTEGGSCTTADSSV